MAMSGEWSNQDMPTPEPEEWVYTGDECVSGACAFCNPDHPDHAKAHAEWTEMLSGGGKP